MSFIKRRIPKVYMVPRRPLTDRTDWSEFESRLFVLTIGQLPAMGPTERLRVVQAMLDNMDFEVAEIQREARENAELRDAKK